MTEALINPAVLQWAIRRGGLDEDAIAEKLAAAGGPDRVRAWEAGEEKPTFVQARKLAHILHIPFASLFLDRPPLETQALPDLRTVGGQRRQPDPALLDVYNDAVRKQGWYREHRLQAGEPALSFVGAVRFSADAAAVAQDIAQTLGHTAALREGARNNEDLLKGLVELAEEAGILVLRSSTVGANTSRPLDVEMFRGFALSDDQAPLVFINTADAKAAQTFTLIHELTHIWRAETGVSRPDLEAERPPEVADAEAFCDRVAAEFLVPRAEFMAAWVDGGVLEDTARTLAAKFRVSTLVVVRRAFELGRITREAYREFFAEVMQFHRSQKATQKERDGGPGALLMVRLRNGRRFTEEVVRATVAGNLLYRDAGRLLGVKPSVIDKLANASRAEP
ncbi:MAG: ImmA/IrrE family metallo-endopeptidase [Deltaproteobacteria bacterium]|nr:ImmA/IrrE family metallo-endopeptidase [Deltaproteobacteria bacterium]